LTKPAAPVKLKQGLDLRRRVEIVLTERLLQE
jgi:hypothetical protein